MSTKSKTSKRRVAEHDNKQASGKLTRTTFRTSREMDFFTRKELVTQTGHGMDEWPCVIVKELMDNALDACEEADTAPVIDVIADETGITVRDNGPGLPESTLKGAMDFTIRVSNREAYVSPCRGAQGNALKTLLPMPRVLDPDNGRFIVTTYGRQHVITCGADAISQQAVVHHDVVDLSKSKNLQSAAGKKKQAFSTGTDVRIEWSQCVDNLGAALWPFGGRKMLSHFVQVQELVHGFAIFNPHATIRLECGDNAFEWEATNPTWEKWKPSHPTSSHWYAVPQLERLIGAYITHDRESKRDRLVSALLSEFDGLIGSAKRTRVLNQAGLKRMMLSELIVGGRLDTKRIARLLAAMQSNTRPVNSPRLGIIGEDHFRERFLAMGVKPESFRYCRKLEKVKKSNSKTNEKASFLPWVLEAAFGWLGDGASDSRSIFTGANWSAAINNPFRSFGGTSEGFETVLSDMRATSGEPVVFALHLTHPRIEYTDRGKSALVIGGIA